MSTSKEVILDAANSMVQQLRRELESITKERDELKIKLLEVAHLKHELATLRDTVKRRLELLRSLNDANRLHIYPAIFCCECGAAFHISHKPTCPLASELEDGK